MNMSTVVLSPYKPMDRVSCTKEKNPEMYRTRKDKLENRQLHTIKPNLFFDNLLSDIDHTDRETFNFHTLLIFGFLSRACPICVCCCDGTL